jgi:hypothetical protein
LLSYEKNDSQDFINELKDKLKAIESSIKIGSIIPEITFALCPCCLEKTPERETGECSLCGSKDVLTQKEINLQRMKNEIALQLKESCQLLNKKHSALLELRANKKELLKNLRKETTKTNATITSINSTKEDMFFNMYTQIGETEEKIENLENVKELYISIKILTDERAYLQKELSDISDLIHKMETQIIKRGPEVKETISKHLISILKADIGAEEDFKNAESVDFDFASNRVHVNKKSSFSESGIVYLNNAFHLALFLTSLEKKYLRLPRFMILDGIENGGMEDIRSKNFQKVIQDKLSFYDIDHQIIIATKSIALELNSDDFVIGSVFTESNRSLS